MDLRTTRRNASWLNLALVLAVLVLATGCGSSVAARPTPTLIPTVTPTPTPHPAPTPVSGLLAPPPTDCQAVATPHTMTLSADFGGGFVNGPEVSGSPPVWQLGLGFSPLNLETYGGYTPYPGTKVLWIVGPNYSEQVTLQGRDLRTGTPMWFLLADNGNDNPANAAPSVTLDPTMPNRAYADNSAGHWNIYGVLIYFTVAGCYELDVTWPEGHFGAYSQWRTVFAVGR